MNGKCKFKILVHIYSDRDFLCSTQSNFSLSFNTLEKKSKFPVNTHNGARMSESQFHSILVLISIRANSTKSDLAVDKAQAGIQGSVAVYCRQLTILEIKVK